MRRVASKWVVLSCGVAALGLAACASIFGVNGGELLDGSADGASSDAPFDYVLYDAIDLDVNTALCDGGVPISDAAIWVSGSGTDSNSCGDQATPCKTIAQAFLNLDKRTVVYLDNSVFQENVTISSSGLTLQGGWIVGDAGSWTAVCNSGLTTIQGPDDGGSAAIEINNAADVTLRLLTIRSKTNGAPGTGESVYAVRAVSAPNVLIDNSTLLAQGGGYGLVGTTPSAPNGCDPTTGGDGGPGQQGAAGDAGSFGMTDFAPSTGNPGSPGENGISKMGQPGVCRLCSEQCP